MASQLIIPLTAPCLDNNGNILSGAKAKFYDADTLAPKNVYSDYTLTTSLGNVITADSAGRMVDLWAEDGSSYRVIWENAAGVEQKTFNRIIAGTITTGVVQIANYTALRNYSGSSDNVTITDTATHGSFRYDSTDTTSTDNGGTIIVDTLSRRWKRQHEGKIFSSWFSSVGDGVTNNSTILQNAITASYALGGADLCLGIGRFKLNSTITIDDANSGEIDTQSSIVALKGINPQNSVLIGTGTANTALVLQGANGATGTIDAHNYDKHHDFGVYNAAMKVSGKAFTTLENIVLASSKLIIESCLSSVFRNIDSMWTPTSGVVITKGGGFSYHNNNSWTAPKFRTAAKWGLESLADGYVTSMQMSAVGCEGNGTMGDSDSGGIKLRFNGAEGGAGLIIDGGYFEGNKGRADIYLINDGADWVTVELNGITFNRSSTTDYTTNCILLTGKIKLKLSCCNFKSYNGYTPSSGRKYIATTDSLAQIITDDSTSYQDAVEAPTLAVTKPIQSDKTARVWCRFSVSGSTATLIQGSGVASVVRNATGQFTVNYTETQNSSANAYTMNAIGAGLCCYLWSETTNSATFWSNNDSGTLTDAGAYSFVMYGK